MPRKPNPLPACAGVYMLMAPDKRYYIGGSVNIRKRISEHSSGEGAGEILKAAIRKFGLKAFQVVVLETISADCRILLRTRVMQREWFWIEALNPPLNMAVIRNGCWVVLKLEDFREPPEGAPKP